MKQLDSDLFISDASQRFFGLEVGARMTVVRLPGGGLLLHSPVPATPELVSEVRELGTVAHLVAPNRFHHLYVSEWLEAFPGATVHLAPGLDSKRPDLEGGLVLTDAPHPDWADVVEQVALEGLPAMNEVVFFHRPSATLIVCDIAFNIGPELPLPTRLFFKAGAAYGKVTPTLLERVLTRDRPALKRSLERVLAWPFERIVVAHGGVSEKGGRDELVQGYRWLLGAAGG